MLGTRMPTLIRAQDAEDFKWQDGIAITTGKRLEGKVICFVYTR